MQGSGGRRALSTVEVSCRCVDNFGVRSGSKQDTKPDRGFPHPNVGSSPEDWTSACLDLLRLIHSANPSLDLINIIHKLECSKIHRSSRRRPSPEDSGAN